MYWLITCARSEVLPLHMSSNRYSPQVGYHNEHHDFPAIAWTRLPALRELAPEFYDTLPSHPSWPMVTVNFIRDPEVGIFARAKRLSKEAKLRLAADQKSQTKGKKSDVGSKVGGQ